MVESTNRQEPQSLCRVTIEYDDAIRSIDLENVLTGLRMICQHELAEKTGKTPRDFTNVTKIQSIEKGSIIINIFLDFQSCDFLLNIDLDTIDFIELIILGLAGKADVPDTLRLHLDKLCSAISHFSKFKFHTLKRKTTFETDNAGNTRITEDEKSTTIGF